ncbi:MAG: hypothetical protein ACREMV_10455 [Gemmatimonadales bacterium]
MIAGLGAARVRFVVVGGVAAGLQGSVHATLDLDICYDPAPDNRRRLAALLKRWGAYLRGVEPGLPFILDEKTLATAHVLTLTTAHGDLDVMDAVAGVGTYQDVHRASVEVEASGTRFRALGLRGLIRAKRAVGRPRDLTQLPELEALLELERRRLRSRGGRGGR